MSEDRCSLPSLADMRAVQITRFGGPEVLDVADLPDPVPGPGQQLYEVSSAGINFADTHQQAATHVAQVHARQWSRPTN
jgi:NADPH:quinone reductase-like Zn-dependent oxidoreductase